jgi:hypothetical protein
MIVPAKKSGEEGVNQSMVSEALPKQLSQKGHRVEKEDFDKKKPMTNKNKKVGNHGLAPKGMSIPVKGKSFRVGGIGSSKTPVKESSHEKCVRIKSELEEKKKKKDKATVKKLKKEGKVGTLASFMYL